jgi:hypothetical protein
MIASQVLRRNPEISEKAAFLPLPLLLGSMSAVLVPLLSQRLTGRKDPVFIVPGKHKHGILHLLTAGM